MKTVLSLFVVVSTCLAGWPAKSSASPAVSIEDAAAAAKAGGFKDKIFPKAGEPYTTSKELSAKDYELFKAFPKSKADSSIKQIAIDCNQCSKRKITEAFSVPCFEDVQLIARKLKLDLPGGVIKTYESLKTPQASWNGTDKYTKTLRFTKMKVTCDSGRTTEGLRFDFFMK